ncbi:hypothetical protein G6F24_016210 [Rhizopus arrhizus]|nr:hypothetical protein G6F24_016210 [Rhizopus arrhizus]
MATTGMRPATARSSACASSPRTKWAAWTRCATPTANCPGIGAPACVVAWPIASTGVRRWGAPTIAWKSGRTWWTSRSPTTTSSAHGWAPPPGVKRSMR